MRSHSTHLRCITATLLLSLASPIQLLGTNLGISSAMAARSTQGSELEGDKLSVKSFPRVNGGKFHIAGAFVKKEPSPAELQQRLDELQTILVTQRKNGARLAEADTLNKIGEIHIQLKEYDKALELHQQALAMYEELSDRQGEAETLGYVGNAYFQAGKYRHVEELFRQKLESHRKIGDVEGEKLILAVMRHYVSRSGEWFLWPAFWTPPANLSWQDILQRTQLNLFFNREIADREAEENSLHGVG